MEEQERERNGEEKVEETQREAEDDKLDGGMEERQREGEHKKSQMEEGTA